MIKMYHFLNNIVVLLWLILLFDKFVSRKLYDFAIEYIRSFIETFYYFRSSHSYLVKFVILLRFQYRCHINWNFFFERFDQKFDIIVIFILILVVILILILILIFFSFFFFIFFFIFIFFSFLSLSMSIDASIIKLKYNRDNLFDWSIYNCVVLIDCLVLKFFDTSNFEFIHDCDDLICWSICDCVISIDDFVLKFFDISIFALDHNCDDLFC